MEFYKFFLATSVSNNTAEIYEHNHSFFWVSCTLTRYVTSRTQFYSFFLYSTVITQNKKQKRMDTLHIYDCKHKTELFYFLFSNSYDDKHGDNRGKEAHSISFIGFKEKTEHRASLSSIIWITLWIYTTLLQTTFNYRFYAGSTQTF